MSDVSDWRASERAINTFAYKVARRLTAAGVQTDMIEDVRQELWIAWCKARDGYNPEAGASFLTYLFNGMRLHINRWVDNNVSRRHAEVVALSLDKTFEEDGDDFYEIISAESPDPYEEILSAKMRERVLLLLKPRARKFLELLSEPPAEVLEEVRRIEAKRGFARSRGISMPFSNRVTTSMIFRLMGASRCESGRIFKEIEKVTAKVQRGRI